MNWMDLYLLLKSMAEQGHVSLTETPAVKVTVIMENEQWELDLVESLSTGHLTFIPKMGV